MSSSAVGGLSSPVDGNILFCSWGNSVDSRLSTTLSTLLPRRRSRHADKIQKVLRHRMLGSHSLNLQLHRSTFRHPHNMGLPPSLGKTKSTIPIPVPLTNTSPIPSTILSVRSSRRRLSFYCLPSSKFFTILQTQFPTSSTWRPARHWL